MKGKKQLTSGINSNFGQSTFLETSKLQGQK